MVGNCVVIVWLLYGYCVVEIANEYYPNTPQE